MLKGKKIIVTSGGTQEFIDDVRVMTNISTGKLGSIIADTLARAGAIVKYVHTNTAMLATHSNVIPHSVISAQDTYDLLEKIISTANAVIHCMAVSDFTFKRDTALKCKSNDPMAFIDYMRRTITVNPKIISKIKIWNPNIFLVGFKFEVGAPYEELISIARSSIEKNKCDVIIANDKIEMDRIKDHVAHFVLSDNTNTFKVTGKDKIALNIKEILDKKL